MQILQQMVIQFVLLYLSRCILLCSGELSTLLQKYLDDFNQNPSNLSLLQVIINTYNDIGDFYGAGVFLENSLRHISDPAIIFNSGQMYLKSGSFQDAIRMFQQCSSYSSRVQRQCHIKLAQCYRDYDRHDLVQIHLKHAIDIDPKNPDAYNYLADTYNNIKQFKLALGTYMQAIEMSGSHVDPSLWIAVGDTYSNLKNIKQSLISYRKALKIFDAAPVHIRPQIVHKEMEALVGYYNSALGISMWKNQELNSHLIYEGITLALDNYFMGRGTPSPLSPYRCLFMDIKPTLFQNISISWSSGLVTSLQPELQKLKSLNTTDKCIKKMNDTQKIHIGYLSRRFEEYPGTQMMLGLFHAHSRHRVHVSAFAHGVDDLSIERAVVRNDSDYFIDISSFDYVKSASTVADQDIDVLIDYGKCDLDVITMTQYRYHIHDICYVQTRLNSFLSWYMILNCIKHV
jgi:tetratricopeptide (TPR) repeat protein